MLELLHPDGNASTAFVLGGNPPKNLLLETSIRAEQKIGLFMLAPTAKECRTEGWLESAAEFVHQRLADDGVCYLLVPPYWRWQAIRLLTQSNLVRDSSFWHFPDLASSHYLVPLQQGPAQFAVEDILPAHRWKKFLAKKIFGYQELCQLLGTFWNPVGITFRRPNARTLFQWLFQGERGTAIVRRSWRGDRGPEILYCFKQSDAQPSAIVKTASTRYSSARIDREANVLARLEAGLQSADARVPEVLREIQTDERSSLFLSPIPGQSASELLVSNPDLLLPIFTKIVRWLERWHSTTKQVQTMDVGQLKQAIFIPLDQLAPYLQNAERYRNWLLKRIQALSEIPLPFVAAHNDLTMANVLVSDRLGIVDWETGTPKSWPLIDFYYAVTDAVRLAQGSTSWLGAFKACYQMDGSYVHEVNRWERQLRSAIGISTRFAELCFHVCWLHHASNEQKVTLPGEARPFLQIVQWLALSCSPSTGNRNLENAKETDPEKNNPNYDSGALADSQHVAVDSKC